MADVAATIVYEVAHICLGNVKLATLVNHFYLVRFAAKHGWSHADCCGEELSSWDPGDWDQEAGSEDNVHDAVSFQEFDFSGCR